MKGAYEVTEKDIWSWSPTSTKPVRVVAGEAVGAERVAIVGEAPVDLREVSGVSFHHPT